MTEETEENVNHPLRKSISVDISELYKFTPKDLVIEIVEEHYSNLAYIQVTPRDVYIDFLPMPGVKRDGKMIIKGTRVYMPHSAAQKLAEVLGQVLEISHKENKIETYQPTDIKEEPKSKLES